MMLNVDDGCSVLLSFFFGKASLYISLKISLNGMKIVCIFFLYESEWDDYLFYQSVNLVNLFYVYCARDAV